MIIFRDIWLRTFKIWKFELKTLKNESRKFQTKQYEKQNSNLSLYSILMRYGSELF